MKNFSFCAVVEKQVAGIKFDLDRKNKRLSLYIMNNLIVKTHTAFVRATT